MDAKKMIEQMDGMILQLQAMQAALRADAPVALPSIESEAKAGICHYCKQALADEKPIRGDHPRCYKEIMRAIAANEVTELDVLAKGWIAPAKPAGRKRNVTPLRQLSESAAEVIAKSIAEEINNTKPKKVADKKNGYRKDS